MKMLLTGASSFIGTNLVESLSAKGWECLNLDVAPPLRKEHRKLWRNMDIMDRSNLLRAFREYRPTHVIHLAARTDCDETTTVEAGYSVNTIGTRNVVEAIQMCRSTQRFLVASTQYVIGPRGTPANLKDYCPHTVYGWSKVETEKIVEQARLDCLWTIIRPVNVWGPWHMRYRRQFLRVMKRGLYVHPGRQPVYRTYGYVGNVVSQMEKILAADETVAGQIYYLGDRPIDVYEWVNGFSLAIHGRPVRVVPRAVVRTMAGIGDLLKVVGIAAPITSSRYRNMTEEYLTPMDRTFEAFGEPPIGLTQGIRKTVEWLNQYGWT